MKRLILSIGINDADYRVEERELVTNPDGTFSNKLIWICPTYQAWRNMLIRCYSLKEKERNPTYKDAMCIEAWLVFSAFKLWSDAQGGAKGKQLDKDIISPNNKLYSPETCAYVLKRTNGFVLECSASVGEYALGVSWKKANNKFQASCSNPFTKKREYLGLFSSETEAHEAWRKRKHELAQLVSATESDPRVVEALKKRYSVEEWYGQS